MHRVGTEKAIEVARRDAVDRRGDRPNGFDQSALRIFCQRQAVDTARRVLQRCFDGVQAKKPERAFGVLSAMSACAVDVRLFCALGYAGALASRGGKAIFSGPRLFVRVFGQGVSRD
jgi:hypothetical protein